MQLYAFLESLEKYGENFEQVQLIYRTSNKRYRKGYEEVFKRFKNLNLTAYNQSVNPNNFKYLVIDALKKNKDDCVFFAVDDLIITGKVDFLICKQALQTQVNARGFYLRLGKNITQEFNGKKRLIPNLKPLDNQVFSWGLKAAKHSYWKYPNSVDFVLYRKNEILHEIIALNFNSPNTLEGRWASKGTTKPIGLCFAKSKVVNVLANVVQEDRLGHYYNLYPLEHLQSLFEKGYKIDINPFDEIYNNCPHSFLNYHFINRD